MVRADDVLCHRPRRQQHIATNANYCGGAMSKQETYISIDIETDGPCPGINSMLSLGAVAFRLDGSERLVSAPVQWSANVLALPEGEQNPDTMKWWLTQPRAWAALQVDAKEPKEAIEQFVAWIDW